MIPKIKEFDQEELLQALAYYKVVVTKLYEIKQQQSSIWYEVHLSSNTLNNKHLITINTGRLNNNKNGR